MKLVSVIIPTYNRFDDLIKAIHSVISQTHTNLEIIVVNDCSTQKEYYNYDFNSTFGKLFSIIHLDKNSSQLFGHASAGYTRTIGCKQAIGDYIAFLDDDDVWLPNKLENQIKEMVKYNCDMSCTEGYIGKKGERYNQFKSYLKYNSQKHFNCLKNIYIKNGIDLLKGFPKIWDLDFVQIHNCIITSSVIVKKDLLKKINYMKNLPNGKEDYDCWKRLLEYSNCVYINKPCFFYSSLLDHNKYTYSNC
tara:strand:- start:1571 stop:2314 length:744 start_codon:yes stop_codon:yes gene_type:complete